MDTQQLEQIGPYRVIRFIEEGGMGWVFEVEDPEFPEERRLALKLLKPEAAAGEEFQRFWSEAGIQAQLGANPNLVTIFRRGQDQATGCHYYTMEFIDGPTLDKKLKQEGPLSPSQAHDLFGKVLNGLNALHTHPKKIVHRDIKPQNILIDSDGRPRLADLGIAKQRDTHTKTGLAIGTPPYMSPEQIKGLRDLDCQSDIFSLGITLYEALTGQRFYKGVEGLESTEDVYILTHLIQHSQKRRELRIRYPAKPAVPKELKRVIEKAVRIRPEDRYADAAAMKAELDAAMGQAPGPDRLRIAAAAAVLSLVIGIGVGASMWWRAREARSLGVEALESARALSQGVPEMLEKLKDLQPGQALPPALNDSLERGREYLANCERDIDLREYKLASTDCGRASEKFGEACAALGGEGVAEKAQGLADDVGRRLDAMRGQRAQELLPERFAELEALYAGLSLPPAGVRPCKGLELQLARIDNGGDALARADEARIELIAEWRRRVDRQRIAAETARPQQQQVEALEYVAALRAAEAAFARAGAHEEAGRYAEAFDEYGAASRSFGEAQDVAAAVLAREQILDFLGQKRAAEDVRLALQKADELFGRRQWKEAREAYASAFDVATRGQFQQRAEETVRLAREAQRSAVVEGTDRARPDLLETPNGLLVQAESALRSGRHRDAIELAERAQADFDRAGQAAIEALAEGRQRLADARRDLEEAAGRDGCGALPLAVQETCRRAGSLLASAEQAIDDRDAPRAARELGLVRDAIGALRNELAALPRAPSIVGRTPTRTRIETPPERGIRLSVDARDDNEGDVLRYAWSFQGRRLDTTGPSVELRPTESGRVEVRVEDPGGLAATASWEVVVNRPPELALSPEPGLIKLELGETRQFRADASDPEGGQVETSFRLDGKPVGSGPRYRYRGSSAGSQELQVIATDALGARQVATWRIAVEAPTRDPLRLAVEGTLERYRGCLNAKDMECLRRVWPLKETSPYFLYWSNKFKQSDPVQVSVSIRSIDQAGAGLTVVFDQIEARPGGAPLTSTYEAELREGTGGGWQIRENGLKG